MPFVVGPLAFVAVPSTRARVGAAVAVVAASAVAVVVAVAGAFVVVVVVAGPLVVVVVVVSVVNAFDALVLVFVVDVSLYRYY